MATKEGVKIAKNLMVSAAHEHALKLSPGGSNVGKYPKISAEDFAGNACGNPGSYPMDTIERARSALAYAHNAKNPDCIRRQVFKKWPQLDPQS